MEQEEKSERLHYSRQFKRHVIEEHLRSGIRISELHERHGIKKHGAIQSWMRQLGYEDKNRPLEYLTSPSLKNNSKNKQDISSDEPVEKRIKELERLLEDERLRSEGYRRMIDIAEKELKIPIRKKPHTK